MFNFTAVVFDGTSPTCIKQGNYGYGENQTGRHCIRKIEFFQMEDIRTPAKREYKSPVDSQ